MDSRHDRHPVIMDLTTMRVISMNSWVFVTALISLSPFILVDVGAIASDSVHESQHTFTGNASWYGLPFHGRKTASGEIFNMNGLSAAHKTLPFPTKVLVENPRNGQAVTIRVTDRGPHVHGRVLDLSREAARRIGTFPGVGYVEATVLPNRPHESKSDEK